jgi:hypothetical protein
MRRSRAVREDPSAGVRAVSRERENPAPSPDVFPRTQVTPEQPDSGTDAMTAD